jgi:hypothetical protein
VKCEQGICKLQDLGRDKDEMKKQHYLYIMFFALVLVTMPLCANGESEIKIDGQIIACRWAFYETTYGTNTDYYLFRINGKNSTYIKLKHEHFGYTPFTNKFVNENHTIALKVKRDAGCDETYNSFKQEKPIRAQDFNGTVHTLYESLPLYVAENVNLDTLSEEKILECFLMEGNEFQIIQQLKPSN